jgi:hypothetical protein
MLPIYVFFNKASFETEAIFIFSTELILLYVARPLEFCTVVADVCSICLGLTALKSTNHSRITYSSILLNKLQARSFDQTFLHIVCRA